MRRAAVLLAIAAALIAGSADARPQAAANQPPENSQADKPVVLDRVIAVINGDVLLESDVEEEKRFAVLEPFSVPAGSDTLERAARRLANRTLILQQMKEQAQLNVNIPDGEVQKALSDLRAHLPQCRQYNCATDEGWKSFLAANNLTEQQVIDHWRQRLAILRFIDLRFRSGIRIPDDEIQTYYTKSILPVYERQNEKPPPLSDLSPRIQEILLQQHVNALLRDWLKSLRDEGSVQILDPAYGQNNHSEDND
jgi:peptidyl-prolyl cis-trans isomerase SurA